MVIDPFCGCGFGFGHGFDYVLDSDCGYDYHRKATYSFHGLCLDMALVLLLAVVETDFVGSPRILCSLVVEPQCLFLGEWRHP